MSKERSPRALCSTTIETSGIGTSFGGSSRLQPIGCASYGSIGNHEVARRIASEAGGRESALGRARDARRGEPRGGLGGALRRGPARGVDGAGGRARSGRRG